MNRELDEKYMQIALKQAMRAKKKNEIPIGAVIVFSGNNSDKTKKKAYTEYIDKISKKYKVGDIISKACNMRNIKNSALAHAEVLAIKKANKKLKDFRLEGCTMYVTLEPCQMCAGALVQSRIDRIVIGAMSPKSGSMGSIINIVDNEAFNHQIDVTYNILEKECSNLIKDYFADMRNID